MYQNVMCWPKSFFTMEKLEIIQHFCWKQSIYLFALQFWTVGESFQEFNYYSCKKKLQKCQCILFMICVVGLSGYGGARIHVCGYLYFIVYVITPPIATLITLFRD